MEQIIYDLQRRIDKHTTTDKGLRMLIRLATVELQKKKKAEQFVNNFMTQTADLPLKEVIEWVKENI